MNVFNPKTAEVIESPFRSNLEAASYMQSTRGDRLKGFRKGMVALGLSGREMSASQTFHLHQIAKVSKAKDERQIVKTVSVPFSDINLFDHVSVLH